MPEIPPCPKCGLAHVSKAGNALTHGQWAAHRKMNAPGGPAVAARELRRLEREAVKEERRRLGMDPNPKEVERGSLDGVRHDFAQEVMDVYGRMKEGVKGKGPLDKYAWEDPGRYIERVVLPVALKQAEPDALAGQAKKVEQQTKEDAAAQRARLDAWWEERQKKRQEATSGVAQVVVPGGLGDTSMPLAVTMGLEPGRPMAVAVQRQEPPEMPEWVKEDGTLRAVVCPTCGLPLQHCMCASRQELFSR